MLGLPLSILSAPLGMAETSETAPSPQARHAIPQTAAGHSTAVTQLAGSPRPAPNLAATQAHTIPSAPLHPHLDPALPGPPRS